MTTPPPIDQDQEKRKPDLTIGRIVHFVLGFSSKPIEHPSIIVNIRDRKEEIVDLQVFNGGHKDGSEGVLYARHGTEAYTWHWPFECKSKYSKGNNDES